MATVVKAPNRINDTGKISIFLAGSIDMGKAENWQERIERELADLDIVIYNPRRDDWDSTWVQSVENEKFREQVEWELEHIENANLVLFYFDPNGPAPITLLELGYTCKDQDIVVCCPQGYWRRGNVEVLSQWTGFYLVDNIEDFLEAAREDIEWIMKRRNV